LVVEAFLLGTDTDVNNCLEAGMEQRKNIR
jgi:hypothetical protein